MSKLLFDISSENFDGFFEKEAEGMTEAQKEILPKELLFKLYAKGGRVNAKETAKMSFLSKLFVLFKVFRKKIIIIIEDANNSMTVEEFFEWKKETDKQVYSQDSANKLISNTHFVLGNKELCDTFHRLNGLSASPMYSYLIGAKNKDYTQPQKWLDAMDYICRNLSHYEANRKKIAMQQGLSMAEWLVLIHLYSGNLVKGSTIYKSHYKYTYNTSSRRIKGAFSVLQSKGFIEKVGVTSDAKIRITALGKDKTNEILKKLVLNC